MAKLLMVLPNTDFDPTESSVIWEVLLAAGHQICFATEDGSQARCDQATLTGAGLAPWGLVLKAKSTAIASYASMEADAEFQAPSTWSQVDPTQFDGLILPGGHAPGMRPFLESQAVFSIIAHFFAEDAPVAAVCHGVLAAARAKDPKTGKSVLFGRRTTALNNLQETTAVVMTKPFLGDHYRTYPESVQDEVSALLEKPSDFETGPILPRFGTADRPDIGFYVRDGNYLSARWPGDVHRWARAFADLLAEAPTATAL